MLSSVEREVGNNGQSRELLYDFIRIVASLAVIVIHTSASYCLTADKSFYWFFAVASNALSRFAVPMFFMISGMFLLKKQEPLDVFFEKRFSAVLIPFLSWCVLYAVFRHVVYGEDLILLLLKSLPSNMFFHLWFVYAILGLYLICPVLRSVYAEKKLNRQEIIYFFTIVFILQAYYQVYFYPEHNRIMVLCMPLVYFLAGHYIGSISKQPGYKKYFLLLIAFLALLYMILGVICSEDPITYYYALISFQTLPSYVFATSLFLFLYFTRESINSWLKKYERLIVKLSSLTFGVYLSHVLVIEILKICWLKNNLGLFHGATVTFVALTALTMILSFTLCYLLSLIPIVKKYFL